MNQYKLPKDFLLGVATASVQIEGGDTNNSWYAWCEAGMVPNGDHCIVANDHWNRLEEDIALLKQLGVKTYRFSLEWARIEPTQGDFSIEAIKHYRKEIELLLKHGITPLVTLHHFSNPIWLEDQGAWLNAKVVEYFCQYTRYVVSQIGDLVTDWVTINEPNVYLYSGYVDGIFPPGVKGKISSYFKGAKYMCLAHCNAYQLIHHIAKERGYTDYKVGSAVHLRVFDLKKQTRLGRFAQGLYYRFFQEIFLNAMIGGQFDKRIGGGYPKGMQRFSDFIGINYYSRDLLTGSLNPMTLFANRHVQEGSKTNDLGWEIYPEGLSRLIVQYYSKFKLPIYITENGIADAADEQRKDYITSHLKEIVKCIDKGIPVQRYYHWTLMDNFEWMEGYEARFGLYAHDVATQERTLRSSGEYYKSVCKSYQI